ncbi:MAG: hypothetical protein GXP32_08930 [Kiritimatiellaeota bacterium]|nr:hypothetical protein [Kiritimatiellota bacterium]
MNEMTGRERIGNILRRKPVDRVGLFEHFWGDTRDKWVGEGRIDPEEDLSAHFGFDLDLVGGLKLQADYEMEPIIIEEDEDTVLKKDGNGAFFRTHKHHNATPEHVDFTVKDRAAWEEFIKPLLTPDPERINFESYRELRRKAAENERFFCWSGVNVFELMHPVCGHEYMLIGMAMDPDWIRDMVDTYAELTVNLLETLFEREGKPDGIWFYEDMGFKERPFMSPGMYEEIVQPGHKRTIDFAHSLGLPVIMHSCGYIEPLLPGMVEAGIDCLQVIEVKAGMDLLRIHKDFGDVLSLCGGMDARNLVANDLNAIKAELNEKIPIVKDGFGYILHSDHSIPDTCDYDTYRYFVDEGLRLGNYF